MYIHKTEICIDHACHPTQIIQTSVLLITLYVELSMVLASWIT